MKFGCNRPSSFREEVVDGRTTEPAYTISSPGAFGSGELKTSQNIKIVKQVKNICLKSQAL